ncbi:hypothetical protein [uncultured Methanobrevibacter sp.]|uniref:hypothetical protein n=1 Tax=uncultured Methanobrevibacter sp. TaxID=253161 RepID=UPI0025D27B64|nr:hypothetical protein [uncultured Methanobrevibacter sp.]
MKNNEKEVDIKKCKKCGCELASDTRGNLCLNCKKKRVNFWGLVGKGTLAVASVVLFLGRVVLFVVTRGKKGL